MINNSRQLTRSLRFLPRFDNNPALSKQIERHRNAIYSMQMRCASSRPFNTIMLFVPQQEAWIIERMGKYHRILEPGVNFLIPIVDSIKYVQSLKEIAIDVPQQSAVTADNVTLEIDGVLYLRINDPYLASYGVEDPEFAIVQLAQTTMRSEIGKISLDKVFREREDLNVGIVEAINKASEAWGIVCLRYEIRDIKLPTRIQNAMQMQVEAERKKRAAILESEGQRESEINIAEGKRQAKILTSEAERQEQINRATGEASAMLAIAEARAKGLRTVASSLGIQEGKDAAGLYVAEQYVKAFHNLAKTNNTLILPSNVGDVPSLVAQAMAIYKHSTATPHLPENDSPSPTRVKKLSHNLTIGSDEHYGDASNSLDEYFSDKEEAEKYKRSQSKSNK